MAEYLAPGVFIEDNPNAPVIEAVSASTAGFIGVAPRGVANKPTFITSWNGFLSNFAYGMDSAFMQNSDLSYAVYGFFMNGGKRCYITRVLSESAAKAVAAFPEVTEEAGTEDTEDVNTPVFEYPTIEAKDEGAWGNKLSLSIKENEDNPEWFDIIVKMNDEEVEPLRGFSNDPDADNYWITNVAEQSNFITPIAGTLIFIDNVVFSGGADGIEDITDMEYTNALTLFDNIDDVNLLAIPGQTSDIVLNAIMSYCENRKDVFALLEAPETATVESVRELRKKLSCKNAALLFPWIRVTDPLNGGKLRNCPPSGHCIGVYARVITERGVWKAPAGTEANLRGAIEVVTTLTNGEVEVLNPANVICIIPKTNYGIVIWGARNLHPDSSMKYVSDVLLDINIKKSVFNATQQFVFEPNDSITWTKVKATVEAFLDNLWREGGLYGESAAQAYYVKCDEDLNTEAMRNAGKMICEIGYANKKPAEFVIFRFSHQVASS